MTFPHLATIQSKTKTGTKYTFTANGSTICFVQPLDIQSSKDYGITFTKGSRCYLPFGSSVIEGDRLTVNGITYGVKGVVARDYGNLKHKQAILEQL